MPALYCYRVVTTSFLLLIPGKGRQHLNALLAQGAIKGKIAKLVDAVNNSAADLQGVEDCLNDCARYIANVVAMETALTVTRNCMENREYREHIAQLDSSRKRAHDALIASVKILGRLCRLYRVEPIYAGPDERIQIAEFTMQVVGEMFQERRL